MFGIDRKSREDAKRILEANRREPARHDDAPAEPEKLVLEKGDLKAMILAVLATVLPYVLIFLISLFIIYKILMWIW